MGVPFCIRYLRILMVLGIKKKRKRRNRPAAKLERQDPKMRTHFEVSTGGSDIFHCIISLSDGDHSVFVVGRVNPFLRGWQVSNGRAKRLDAAGNCALGRRESENLLGRPIHGGSEARALVRHWIEQVLFLVNRHQQLEQDAGTPRSQFTIQRGNGPFPF